MKNIILILFSVSLALNINAQSRNNKDSDQLRIESKSTKLRDAIGWRKDLLGTWVSNTNALSDIKLDEKSRYSVPQNFKWVQFVEFRADKKPYYGILYESEIYLSGLENEKRVYYYLISPTSYQNLTTAIKNKSGETLTIQSNLYGYMSNSDGIYTQQKLLRLINKSLLESNNHIFNFKINAQHVDQTDVVRFRLPEQLSGLDTELSNDYFEVSWDAFSSILLPVSGTLNVDEFELEDGTTSNKTGNNLLDENDILSDRDIPLESKNTINVSFADTAISEKPDTNTPKEIITERISEEGAIVSNPIAILKDITGWYKNAAGKWVSDKANDYSYDFETVGQYELRHLAYREVEYIILIRHEKYAGASHYLIKKEDYDKELEKLNASSTLNFPLVTSCGIGYNLDDLIKKGVEAINAPVKEKIIINNNYLTVQQRSSVNRNIARFFIYEKKCTQYGESGGVTCNTNVSNKIKYDDVHYIGTDLLFDKMYYETNLSDFIKFFKALSKETYNKQTSQNFR